MARDYWLILRHTVNTQSARGTSSYERISHERISFFRRKSMGSCYGPRRHSIHIRINASDCGLAELQYLQVLHLAALQRISMVIRASRIVSEYNRQYRYCRYTSWHSIPNVILMPIEVRLLSVSIDPIFSRRLMPNVVNNLFLTGSWPFALTATLLISFYWYVS
jgi:hypothetical protein